MRLTIAVALLVLMSGCVTIPENTVSLDTLNQYKIAQIDVDVPEQTQIWWGAAEREYAKSQGCNPPDPRSNNANYEPPESNVSNTDCDYSQLIETPEAKAYLREKLDGALTQAMENHYIGALQGTKPAKLYVRTEALTIASGGQTFLTGSAHQLGVYVSLIDQTTGEEVIKPEAFGEVIASSGLIGVIMDAASDPLEIRLSNAVAEKSRGWMLHENKQ